MEKVKIEQSCGVFSWAAGWLFTIGFLKLALGKAVLAIVLWPYYIGTYISTLVQK